MSDFVKTQNKNIVEFLCIFRPSKQIKGFKKNEGEKKNKSKVVYA